MTIVSIILAVLLAAVLTMSGIAKLTKSENVVESLTKANVPLAMYPLLALAEIAGAVGLMTGIWWTPIGIAAAVGVVLYFAGAVVFHVRAKDPNFAPPAVLGLVAVAAGITLALA